MTDDVLIIGVSARAAAFSALRGGLRPRCIDHFADRDLAAACPVVQVESARGADGLAEAADALPPSPWFYVGGMENHPEHVERISHRHYHWGIGADALRRVRDPILVARVLAAADLPVPEVRVDADGLPRDGSWLVKPLASAAGIDVAPLRDQPDAGGIGRYYQRRVDGTSYSAIYIARAGGARLVGAARQWGGGLPGRPFGYRGGIGPCRVIGELAARLRALGDRLAAAFDLVGWFGVDYILRDRVPWPIEVNPRYTASVEIHELATGRPLLPEHRAACEGRMGPADGPDDPPPRARVVAKWIIYAARTLIMPESEIDPSAMLGPGAFEAAADVPEPGSVIEAGEPVMTLLAADRDARSCRARLRRLRASWMARLGPGAC